jgi:hypothetical protein
MRTRDTFHYGLFCFDRWYICVLLTIVFPQRISCRFLSGSYGSYFAFDWMFTPYGAMVMYHLLIITYRPGFGYGRH